MVPGYKGKSGNHLVIEVNDKNTVRTTIRAFYYRRSFIIKDLFFYNGLN